MKRFVAFVLTLFVGASIMAQGSAPAPSQLWRYKTNKDTLVTRLNSGDTVKIYDSAGYTVFRTKGTNTWFRIPDSIRIKYLLVDGSAEIDGAYLNAVQGIIFGNKSVVADTVNTLGGTQSAFGSGLSILNGQMTANLGDTIDDTSEVKRFMLNGRYLNPTSDFIFSHVYKGTDNLGNDTLQYSGGFAGLVDSELVTLDYSATHIGGKLIGNSVATTGHVPVYDATNDRVYWQAQSSSSGGTGIQIDSTAGTATGNNWVPSTLFLRPDSQVTFSKGAAADTLIIGLNGRTLKLKGTTRDTLYVQSAAAGDTFFMINNNGTTTTLTARGENNAFRIGKPLTLDGGLTFSTSSPYAITSPSSITGNSVDGGALYIDDVDGVALGGTYSPMITMGASYQWYFHGDTLRNLSSGGTLWGNSTKINGVRSIITDTATTSMVRMTGDSIKWVTGVGTQQAARRWRRDTANAVTIDTTPGILRLVADPGYTWIDSLRVNKYMLLQDSTGAKRNLDSAANVVSDTVKAKVVLRLLGATSGAVSFKARATAGSTVYTLPPDSTNGLVLSTNGSGTLSWVTGGGGSGNGSADFDTLATKDTATLTGSAASIFKVKQVGVNRTALTAGANTTLELGLNSGVPIVDSNLLVYSAIDFGSQTAGAMDTMARLDSAWVHNLRRVVKDSIANRKGRFAARTLFFPAQGVYGRPKAPGTGDSVYLTAPHWMDSASGVLWAWTDSSLKGTDTDYVYQTIMFNDSALIDSLSFLYIVTNSAVLDTVKIYKQWALGTIADTLKATIGVAGGSTTRARVVAAVNGATGWAVSRGEIWTVKFRNKFPSANGVVRVFGLAARGTERP